MHRPTSPPAPPGLGLIACGGAVGASLRWAMLEVLPMSEPLWALLVVNGLGCLAVGWLRSPDAEPLAAQAALTIGFCGGLTTFSTLSVEAALLLEQGRGAVMVSYLAVSTLTGIALLLAGKWLRCST